VLSWRTRWRLIEYVRNSIWLVPAIFVLVAIAMGVLLPDLDAETNSDIGIEYGASSAEGMLGAMAGGMITFTGFVFSILLLAVQFGSSQFSPRMLRRFLRDPTTKIALGMFMATFIYALLVLRTIEPVDNPDFIPDFSVSVSVLMLLVSMFMFLRLISHTTQGLRVAAVVKIVGDEGAETIIGVYGDPAPEGGELPPSPLPATSDGHRLVTFEEGPGILQSIDHRGLVKLATEAGVVVELVASIGDLVVTGASLFRIHGDGAIDEDALRRSAAVGDERNMRQDPAFAFRLLADISSKALSPGVNDPTTSVQALDQIEILLRIVASRKLLPGEISDESGSVRLVYPAPSWEDYLSIGLDEARLFGADSIQIMRRLRALLEDLLATVPEFRRPAVENQLGMLEASVARTFTGDADLISAGTRDRQGIGSPRWQ
jgi:uncharacterized membrane protein